MKTSALLFLLMLPLCCIAQTNPQKGSIVTLTNDTIVGTINDRYAVANARQCDFKAEGEDTFKTYLPGQINSFTIDKSGLTYQTLSAVVDGQDSTFFAQRLVAGTMSLFCLPQTFGNDIYFVVRDGIASYDCRYERGAERNKRSERRAALSRIIQMGSDSETFVQEIWKNENNRETLTETVLAYNREKRGMSATEAYTRQKKETVKVPFFSDLHLLVMGGVALQSVPLKQVENIQLDRAFDTSLSGLGPAVSLGANYHFTRFDKGLSVEALFSWMQLNVKNDNFKNIKTIQLETNKPDYYMMSMKGNFIDLELGLSYRFCPSSRIQPLLRAGSGFSHSFGVEIDAQCYYEKTQSSQQLKDIYFSDFDNHAHSNGYFVSLYAGAGVAIPLSHGTLLLYADYDHQFHPIQMHPFRIRLGYEF